MFTGIVTDVGEVAAVEPRAAGLVRLRIACGYDPDAIAIGASIACSGVCLTVVARGRDGDRGWFEVDAAAETLRVTTIGTWRCGSRINLERALKVGEELGGHIVAGHVDGLATLSSRESSTDMARLDFRAPTELARFIAPKGSKVAIGVKTDGDVVEIAVTDQGIGIAEADRERIFERFYRADEARSRRTGGTGLGLSIVKHATQRHGGEVRLWSRPGRGSTFTIRLPRIDAPGADSKKKSKKKKKKRQ